jgi:hypothetical protein
MDMPKPSKKQKPTEKQQPTKAHQLMKTHPAQDVIPRHIRAFLPKPPLLVTENPQHYGALFRAMVDLRKPVNVADWLGLVDLTNDSWELMRMTAIKTAVLGLYTQRAVHALLLKFRGTDDIGTSNGSAKVAAAYMTDPKVKQDVHELLAKRGLDESCIVAQTFMLTAPLFETASGIENNLRKRRDQLLDRVRALIENADEGLPVTKAISDDLSDEKTAAHPTQYVALQARCAMAVRVRASRWQRVEKQEQLSLAIMPGDAVRSGKDVGGDPELARAAGLHS